ncbi:hypothetical protein C0J52_15925 [Blattella germanica]|nr:hypothetical protein C0J52_15925 [Blattella germanica]
MAKVLFWSQYLSSCTRHRGHQLFFALFSSSKYPQSINMKFMMTVAILAMAAVLVSAQQPQESAKREKRGFLGLGLAAPYAALPAPYAFPSPLAYARPPLAYAPAPYFAPPLAAPLGAPLAAPYAYYG